MITKKLLSTLAALAAIAIAPTAAVAGEPARTRAPGAIEQSAAGADGIIAILIGLAQAQPYTPPIGSDKGSFAGTGWGLDER
jgi:hypothetical protein